MEQALNSGDIEAALALYEDDAAFVTGDGELARGREGLRAVFDGMVNAKIITKGAPVRTLVVKDLALVFVQYTGAVPLPDGKEMQLSGLSTDVLRQQSDGDVAQRHRQPVRHRACRRATGSARDHRCGGGGQLMSACGRW
jgi:uncharacterized protein (TIGR02246 family)